MTRPKIIPEKLDLGICAQCKNYKTQTCQSGCQPKIANPHDSNVITVYLPGGHSGRKIRAFTGVYGYFEPILNTSWYLDQPIHPLEIINQEVNEFV